MASLMCGILDNGKDYDNLADEIHEDLVCHFKEEPCPWLVICRGFSFCYTTVLLEVFVILLLTSFDKIFFLLLEIYYPLVF